MFYFFRFLFKCRNYRILEMLASDSKQPIQHWYAVFYIQKCQIFQNYASHVNMCVCVVFVVVSFSCDCFVFAILSRISIMNHKRSLSNRNVSIFFTWEKIFISIIQMAIQLNDCISFELHICSDGIFLWNAMRCVVDAIHIQNTQFKI